MNPDLDIGQLISQLEDLFGLKEPTCKDLHMPTNDVVEVTTPTGHFALKLYTTSTLTEIQWELDLTVHLIQNGAPVVRPVRGKDGYQETFMVNGQKRIAVLFEWAEGAKPQESRDTYLLLGKAAALIHRAADTFTSPLPCEKYDTAKLIDEQLERMKTPLVEAGEWQRVVALSERLKDTVANPALDYGICHMDLKPDNVHEHDGALTVFDFDSAGESWRAIEPYRVLRVSEEYFKAWLEGYRTIRRFSLDDEKAVAAFGIIGDLREVVWNLGLARSSRGEPLLRTTDLPDVVDGWLEWERRHL
jgi:Ser/Thr protein kinase RdoA (MazF antagonist)